MIRDDKWINPAARELVPGDVIRIRLGDILKGVARQEATRKLKKMVGAIACIRRILRDVQNMPYRNNEKNL